MSLLGPSSRPSRTSSRGGPSRDESTFQLTEVWAWGGDRYVRENPLKSQQGGALHLENAAVLAPWYVGKMGRHECENLIKASSTGEFLVRSRNKGGYAVCVNDQGDVRNFSVTREHGVFISSNQVGHHPCTV